MVCTLKSLTCVVIQSRMWAWEQCKYISSHKNSYFGITIKDVGLFQETAPPDSATLIYVQFQLSLKENNAIFYTLSHVGYTFFINILVSRWANPCHKENSKLSAFGFCSKQKKQKTILIFPSKYLYLRLWKGRKFFKIQRLAELF